MAADRAVFAVTHPDAPRREADPGIARISDEIAADARSRSPVDTGALAAGWHVEHTGPGERDVSNPVPYARFVEYGTSSRAAVPMLGPAVARYRGGV